MTIWNTVNWRKCIELLAGNSRNNQHQIWFVHIWKGEKWFHSLTCINAIAFNKTINTFGTICKLGLSVCILLGDAFNGNIDVRIIGPYQAFNTTY